jgi:hypothetical protein
MALMVLVVCALVAPLVVWLVQKITGDFHGGE